jgi:hypothetical protein
VKILQGMAAFFFITTFSPSFSCIRDSKISNQPTLSLNLNGKT